MSKYEVPITKTATIIVDAETSLDATLEAQRHLNGDKGYSEYQQDGWEVLGDQYNIRIGETNDR